MNKKLEQYLNKVKFIHEGKTSIVEGGKYKMVHEGRECMVKASEVNEEGASCVVLDEEGNSTEEYINVPKEKYDDLEEYDHVEESGATATLTFNIKSKQGSNFLMDSVEKAIKNSDKDGFIKQNSDGSFSYFGENETMVKNELEKLGLNVELK